MKVADERVLDVQFTDDAISVSLRDGRVIAVAARLVSAVLDAAATPRASVNVK